MTKKNGKVRIPYEKVCVVFDKDNFKDDDFNGAIKKAKTKGYVVAWSNESFELWFLQHFDYYNTNNGRNEYNKKLGRLLTEKIGKKYSYEKHDEEIFNLLIKHGSIKKAIEYSEKLLKEHSSERNYSKKVPATNVVEIVKLLIRESGYKL